MKKIIKTYIIIIFVISFFANIGISITNSDNSNLASREELCYEPKSHDFGNMLEGTVNETIFHIWRGGGCCELTYELFWDETWLDVWPTSGVSNGELDPITVTIDTTGLSLGVHNAAILIQSSAGNGYFDVQVNIVLHGVPTLAYYPQSYNFGYLPEGTIESTEFEIWNTGLGLLTYTLSWEETWVDVYPTSGESIGEHDPITVTIDTNGFEPGSSHTCAIAINSNGGNKVFTAIVNIGECKEIEINEISGGLFRINANIKNIGTCDIYGLDWEIILDGGIIITGKDTSGRYPYIAEGEEVTITSDLIFGIGNTVVTVKADISDSTISDTQSVDAKVLLFYISI